MVRASEGGGGPLRLLCCTCQKVHLWNVVSQVLKRKKSTANHTYPRHVFCMWLGQAVGGSEDRLNAMPKNATQQNPQSTLCAPVSPRLWHQQTLSLKQCAI